MSSSPTFSSSSNSSSNSNNIRSGSNWVSAKNSRTTSSPLGSSSRAANRYLVPSRQEEEEEEEEEETEAEAGENLDVSIELEDQQQDQPQQSSPEEWHNVSLSAQELQEANSKAAKKLENGPEQNQQNKNESDEEKNVNSFFPLLLF